MNAAIDRSTPRAPWMTASDGVALGAHTEADGRRREDGGVPRELPPWSVVSYLQAEAPRRCPRDSAA